MGSASTAMLSAPASMSASHAVAQCPCGQDRGREAEVRHDTGDSDSRNEAPSATCRYEGMTTRRCSPAAAQPMSRAMPRTIAMPVVVSAGRTSSAGDPPWPWETSRKTSVSSTLRRTHRATRPRRSQQERDSPAPRCQRVLAEDGGNRSGPCTAQQTEGHREGLPRAVPAALACRRVLGHEGHGAAELASCRQALDDPDQCEPGRGRDRLSGGQDADESSSSAITSSTRTRTGRRPKRSPGRPKSHAPTGRKKKAMANDAYALTNASSRSPRSRRSWPR